MQREPNEEGKMQGNISLLIRFFLFNKLTLYHLINFIDFTFRKETETQNYQK